MADLGSSHGQCVFHKYICKTLCRLEAALLTEKGGKWAPWG